jgi:NitT/TauT family transport system permease protein
MAATSDDVRGGRDPSPPHTADPVGAQFLAPASLDAPAASAPVREAPRPPMAAPIGRRGLTRLVVAVALIGLWEGGVHLGWIDPFFFSSPSAIASTLAKQFGGGTIYKHIAATLQEALWGLVLGALGGAALAWLSTRSQTIADLLDPVLLLLNSVPRIVLAPIFVMWLGIGMNSKVAVAFFLVFVVVFFAVAAGIREVDRTLIERIVVLGGSQRDLLVEVYLPSVLAWVFSSLRVAVGFAFTGAIVGEFVGASAGLGYLMNFAQGSQNAALMMSTVVIIMVVIVVLFAGLERVERHLMAWK